MPIRDLSILFQITDKVSGILDPILDKVNSVDGSAINIDIGMDPGQAAAQASAFESSLDAINGAGEKLTSSLEKVTSAEGKEGKAADDAGKKTKGAGDAAKQTGSHFQSLKQHVDAAGEKLHAMKGHLDGVKTKLLAVQAVMTGIAAMAVMSTAKTESLVEELKGVKGETYAAPLIDWANQGSDLDWSGKKQRLTIATDLSGLDYSTDEVKKYGTEIEKFFFQKTGQMKRFGISSATELAQAMASAEKSGNLESVRKLFSSGAVSEEKLGKEMTRLRTNYEKFAFATEDVVKKQALHNLMMKELQKTNQSFTGQTTTLEQKLDVLGSKWGSLIGGMGDKLEPVAKIIVDGLIKVIDTIEAFPAHDEILIFFGLVVTAITTIISWIFILAPALEALSWVLGSGGVAGAAATLGGFIGTLGGILGSLAGVVTWVVGGIGALLAGLASIPALPVIAAILAIAAALYLVYTKTTILQDGFVVLKEYMSRAMAGAYKIFSAVAGGLRGNKSDLLDIGTWIRNFLDVLIPGWLSDLFTTAQSIYREALKWFDKIMGWWNSFLKKIGEVYDKIKSMLGLGSNEQEVTPDMQKYGVTGYTTVNDQKAVSVTYKDLPSSEWNSEEGKKIKELTGGKTRLSGKDWVDFAQQHPDLAKKFTTGGSLSIPMEDLGDYGIPDSALPPEPGALPSLPDAPDIPAAIQESGQDYVDNSKKTYDETLEKTGSYTAAAHEAYDPLGFYTDLGKKGLNYLGIGGGEQPAEGEGKDKEKLPAGAVGATVDQSGAMIVHEKEELVPARITSGAGKLATLLGSAIDFVAGRSDIEREISERMTSQETSRREFSAGFGPVTVQVTIQAPVTVQITKEMDLSRLDVTKLIDWSRVSYELEKVVKATFRTQEG